MLFRNLESFLKTTGKSTSMHTHFLYNSDLSRLFFLANKQFGLYYITIAVVVSQTVQISGVSKKEQEVSRSQLKLKGSSSAPLHLWQEQHWIHCFPLLETSAEANMILFVVNRFFGFRKFLSISLYKDTPFWLQSYSLFFQSFFSLIGSIKRDKLVLLLTSIWFMFIKVYWLVYLLCVYFCL